MKKISQIVLLAGGKGTRMGEMTKEAPKPMVPIGDKPVLDHLIQIFSLFGKFEFIICAGYLGDQIQDYYKTNKNIKVIDTGAETPTGGRLFNIQEHLDENFIVTYGDGLANVKINDLIKFHLGNENIGTVTVANPISRFGLVNFDSNYLVKDFIEKPKMKDSYVNIGFMAFNKNIFKYVSETSTLETDSLIKLTEDSQLRCFLHDGYFEPMDTYREYLNMNKLLERGSAPWLKYD
jgi:glucose-1-phosphate cytidylyltransferase